MNEFLPALRPGWLRVAASEENGAMVGLVDCPVIRWLPVILLWACWTVPPSGDAWAAEPDGANANSGDETDSWGRVELGLREVRWQLLPERIAHVAISPDQRIWSVLNRADQSPVQFPPETRQLVEREFSKPSPQLHGIKRLYFEAESRTAPGNTKLRRVWVACREAPRKDTVLLGYDGKHWTEPHTFSVNALDSLSVAFAKMIQLDDAVVFISAEGAHVFKDNSWTLQDLMPSQGNEVKGDSTITNLSFWIREEGRELILSTERPSMSKSGVRRSLWKYRDGNWREVQLPEEFRVKTSTCAMLEDALLFVHAGDQPYRLEGGKLISGKPAIHVLRVAADNEVQELAKDEEVSVGPYQARLGLLIGNDETGRFYATCDEVLKGRKNLGDGLLVHDAGRTQFFPSEKSPISAKAVYGTDIADPTGEGAVGWMKSQHEMETVRSTLMDLETMTVVDRLPDPTFNVIGTASDGTVFAHRKGMPLMAYRPNAKEDRQALTCKPIELDPNSGFCVAGDGSIWVSSQEGRMRRFDGRRWDTPFDTFNVKYNLNKTLKTFVVIPGNDGYLLCMASTEPQFAMSRATPTYLVPQLYLFNGKKYLTTEPLLVKAAMNQKDHFRKAFGGRRELMPWFASQPHLVFMINSTDSRYERTDVRGMGVAITKRDVVWA
ncbi:MAG: hypothetical protein WBF93_16635, partial [Pirellulales bacterium]